MKIPRWLYLKIGLKRWLLLLLVGILFISAGFSVLWGGEILGYLETKLRLFSQIFGGIHGEKIIGFVFVLSGCFFMVYSFQRIMKALMNMFFPGYMREQVKNIYQRQYLKKGPRIVVLGGGTGLSVLLRGLKEYTSNITAIVSVADDGGSSGRLRGQLGILPPGDLRNCLVALADTESAMESLFSYRFTAGDGLAGHSLGNLLIAAMADLTGSFETAIHEVGEVLAIRGKVIPATNAHLVLGAELADGSTMMGQSYITYTKKRIKRVYLEPAVCEPSPEALVALRDADAIILGPGSLYTSVIPNLLIPGMVEEIRKAQGVKIYVCNVMTQMGETKDYTAGDHLEALYQHSGPDLVDYMIVNNKSIPSAVAAQYALEGAQAVEIDREKIAPMNVQLIQAPLSQENNYLRHNSLELASLIISLLLEKKANSFSWGSFTSVFSSVLTSSKSNNSGGHSYRGEG